MNDDAPADAKHQASLFLTTVTDKRPVWGLRDPNGGLATWQFDESGESLIPFWSEKAKAETCAAENFPDYQAFELSAKYFTDAVLPQLEKQGILVGVNLTDQMGGIDMAAADLRAEITGAAG